MLSVMPGTLPGRIAFTHAYDDCKTKHRKLQGTMLTSHYCFSPSSDYFIFMDFTGL